MLNNDESREIKREITKIVGEIAEVPEEQITDGTDFYADLDIDSMMSLEIAAKLEKQFKVVIPEDRIPEIRNIKSVCSLISQLMTDNRIDEL